MTHLPRARALFAVSGLALLGAAVPAAVGANPPASTRLTITANGFKNDTGQAGIAVFRSADGFPSERRKAAVGRALPIKQGKVRWTIPALASGRYAILVLHDENSNGKMDTNVLGIPTEGYGVSRDARRPFGPPLFEDAAIVVKGAERAVGIQVKY
ncbi:MAG: DUF2141 domain-containing protein [Polyangiaceae bacterium]|nr:DUF2141 domain-containing protein [Polyangiaceae bacterium]